MNQRKGLKLTDILVTVVIAVVFGLIYRIWGDVYALVALVGLQAEQLTYGMWFIAATIAMLIIRKPGVALLAEAAAAAGELIAGSSYGVSVFMYGIAQGLGAELIFAAFRYKRFTMGVACLAGIASMVGAFVLDIFRGELTELVSWNLALFIVFRTISSIVITGVFAYYLVKALEATGVTNLVRPASMQDYKDLER